MPENGIKYIFYLDRIGGIETMLAKLSFGRSCS